ncbi:hypothetical protein [Nocardia sp. BMG111209]|uniref:hypothetical protein n=1 Tax=Nocardia sp. BMG111209 TaxID=1160137 RepID=UPI0003AAB3D4|nr:hypothetical protein [Nocardia sp. BMG111209]
MELFLAMVIGGLLFMGIGFSIGFGTGVVFIGLFLVFLVIAGWVLSILARRHLTMTIPASPHVVAEAVERHFSGLGWQAVPGRGELNFRSRGIGLSSRGAENPVLSVSLEDLHDGTTGIEVWMSEWVSRFGIAASCDRVISKRWRLARKLAVLTPVG